MTELRPYQLRAIELLDRAVSAGRRAPLLVLPTGSGKTVIASAIIKRALQSGQSALFLAPRRELVTQASRQLSREGVPHGVLLAGADAQGGLYSRIQVASIDTLLSRLMRRQRLVLPDFQILIVDEAHLSITEARSALLDSWPNALRIGLTATPTRKDGRALGMLYDQLIEPVTVPDLVQDAFLVPARYFSVSEPDLERVHIVAGDYNQRELEQAVNRPKLVGDIVGHWLAHASDRRTVVFATSIAHSAALCDEFLRCGVAAEHVDANTPQEMRDSTFERFRSGQTSVLTNCFLASYGFDLPELSCVVLGRPTKSLMLFLQMIGRGLRPAEGKSDCLVLDHSGCVHRHGFAHDVREWTLDGERALVDRQPAGNNRTEGKMLTCPECSCVFTGGRQCPECGYYLAPKGRQIVTLDGSLVEIGSVLQPEQQDRVAFYAELRGIGVERRWKPGAAAHRYRERYGEFPPWGWNQMPAAKPSKATRDWLLSRIIAWRNAQPASQTPVTPV